MVAGSPLLRMGADDDAERLAAAALIAEGHLAPVGRVLQALDVDDSTLWRARQRLREGGVGALASAKRGPKGPSKAGPAVVQRMVELRRAKLPIESIASRLGVSERTVRRYLVREGVAIHDGETADLPFVDATPADAGDESPTSPSKEIEVTSSQELGTAPIREGASSSTESAVVVAPVVIAASELAAVVVPPVEGGESGRERPSLADEGKAEAAEGALGAPAGGEPSADEVVVLEAMLGAGEAEVVLEPSEHVAYAGLLLTLPVLTATGLLEAARSVYGRLRPGVYGLRATILTLAFLAFLRRPRPEALKGMDPQSLGDVLGLLRAPEVKTVRRKLGEIDAAKKAHELMTSLASRWLKERDDALGVLYVDGHVRGYDGTRKLPKAHVTQKNLCLPATTDYWVNGADGQPLFVVTAQANAAMTKVLPGLLAELEKAGDGRKGTVVFDRGGWSPALFKEIVSQGWHLLTYRKGKRRKHPRKAFKMHEATIDGRPVKYELSERRTQLRNGLRLREIAELRDDGGQTIVVTSHFEHAAVLLAYRMFERWRQENYFQYMKQNFALDALVDYDVEPDDPTRDVPNPARKKLDKAVAEARAEVAKLEQAYGAAAADNVEAERPTTRGFKIANGKTGVALRAAREHVAQLVAKRRDVPTRVAIGTVIGSDRVIRLSPERKLFTDVIKAAVYRAETTLLRLLRPHFPRAEDEGRAFLREAVRLPGALEVTGNDVVVRLSPMSAPRFTKALRGLCDDLNALAPRFPETPYHLRYAVSDEQAP